MVDTRSKVSKQQDKGKHAAIEDLPGGHGASPAQSTGANLVDCPRLAVHHNGTVGRVAKASSGGSDLWDHRSHPFYHDSLRIQGSGAEWYEEQEESSRPRYSEAGGFEGRILLLIKPVGRTLMGTRVPRSTHPPSNGHDILMEIKDSPMLTCPKPIDTLAKFRNKKKYYEYHEDHEHTIAECRELKKALHKLVDWGQLNCFLKKGGGGDHN
ncbi:hypothetical protein Cgig2_021281 [Carnegiea gigantea]|uniref:Uncharacterized protein n=1 Tax=Carnegiea gigantea TaxID=171969 RepID=A0A9Q1GHU3_9CARY|nr:hypothetical protein Cgig2_021281 [Carnegiea gigantea]